LCRPIPSLFWAAGFAFSSGRVVRDVPYDASLRFLFFGEEASMSGRLWTHGWDFYAPSEMVLYHLWTRAYRPVFQELESDETKMQRQRSLDAVRAQLRDGHGLGTERGLAEYQRHIGVDFSTQTVEWRAEWGNLDPIQFDLTVTKENI
jgi:[Skp1-protein]-hydroxyproline N-acetylglucosaminyltransferase